MKRKILAVFIAFALCLGMCPPVALADVAAGNVVINSTSGQTITFTADQCGDSCQGHTITQTVSVAQNTTILVESGIHNITFSGLNLTTAKVGVMPGGTMNLTIAGTNSISAVSQSAGIYVPVGATLVITEQSTGSLDVSGSGSGIGGGVCAPNDTGGYTGNLNCGTVIINGGTITATGGDMSAGIGGACGNSGTPAGGNGGTVTINGGTVMATGGDDTGSYGGAGIGGGIYNGKSGSGGTLTINGGLVTLDVGTHNDQWGIAYGFGRGNGDNNNAGTLTLADESCLTLATGTSLDPNGTYFLNGDPTEDMIVVPEGLVYTGQPFDLTGKISIDDSKTSTITLFERTFSVTASADGWKLQDLGEVVNAGPYTAVFKKGNKTISKTFTVAQSGTTFTGNLIVRNGDVETKNFTVSDTITVIATPTATGQAPTNAAMAASFTEPVGGQMALFVDNTQVSAPVNAGADGTYTMTVNASDVLELGNVAPNGDPIPLTAKFAGNGNMADAAGTVEVSITAEAEVHGTLYPTLKEVFEDVKSETLTGDVTITLLRDIDLTKQLSVGRSVTADTPEIRITLDLNGKTISAPDTALYVSDFKMTLTIQDNSAGKTGSIRGGSGSSIFGTGVCLDDGTLYLTGGSFLGGQYGVRLKKNSSSPPTLEVSGDAVINGTGQFGYGLNVSGTSGSVNIRLSGGTFNGGQGAIYVGSGNTLKNLLAEGQEDVRYAYFDGDTPTTQDLDASSSHYKPITVKPCTHTGEGICEYQSSADALTHSKTCLACGKVWAAEDCKYTFEGHTGTCGDCQSTITLSLQDADNLIYDGTGKKPDVILTRNGETVTEGYSVTYNDHTDAGENTASVVVSYGESWSHTLYFTIKPATLTVTGATITGRDYNASNAVEVTGVAISGTVMNDDVSVNTADLTGAVSSADVGAYTEVTLPTLTLTGSKADNYTLTQPTGAVSANVTISPLEITVIPDSGQKKEYGTADPVLTYKTAPSLIGDDELTGALAYEGTDVGAYSITQGTLAAPSGNYTLKFTTGVMFEITKPSLENATITLSQTSYTYDGTTHTPTVTVVKDGRTLTAGTDYTLAYADNINAGTATATVTGTGNYEGTNSATFTINPKKLIPSITGTTTKTYDGTNATPVGLSITLDGKVNEDDVSAKVDSYTYNSANVNEATTITANGITLDGTSKANYTLTTNTIDIAGSITKADVAVTAPTAGDVEYGQKLADSTLTGGTAVNGSTNVAGTWSWKNGSTQPEQTGTFPMTFSPTDTANYNTPESVNVEVAVKPATPKITLTVPSHQKAGQNVEVTYTVGNPYDAAKDDLPAVTLTYTIGNETKAIDGTSFTIPENTQVGTDITVTASTAEVTGKYSVATKTATVTVTDKTPVEISGITVTDRAYNGKPMEYAGTPVVKTLDGASVTGVDITYTWSGGTSPTNAGSYKLTVSVNGEYIGSTVLDFTIQKATVTITADSKNAVAGSEKPELTYTASGLADGETLATEPTLTCDADMGAVGSYPITASGAVVPDTGNYNSEITYVLGTLTITAKPSSGGSSGGSSGVVSTPPVTTDTTDTTAKPTASTQNGTATTTVSSSMGAEIVKQAMANQSENVVITPQITGTVTKTEVSIPASTVGQIGSQTTASLTISTPVADVTIPNGGLGSLSSAGGTVTVTAEQTGNTVDFSVTAGGKVVEGIPGGVTLTVPAKATTPGTVAVLIKSDGTREVVRKSVADGNSVVIPLDGSAKLEIVDNTKSFADVPSTSWAADAVAFAGAHELFNGTAPSTFSPSQSMSRGMLAVVLHNLESNPDQPLTGLFADVGSDTWYAEGVAWAAENGIVAGVGNGKFAPNSPITREQLATMLWRYAGEPKAKQTSLGFADSGKVSDYAFSALCWATEQGIVNGKGDGILDPLGTATRAEVAQMLMNYLKK